MYHLAGLPNLIVWSFVPMHNVVIIGSGCAGLTAAIYTARANLKPVVLDGHEPGGQLSLTTHVENYPGFPDGIMGPELIENMRKQAQRFGAEFKAGAVTEVDLTNRPFKVTAGKETRGERRQTERQGFWGALGPPPTPAGFRGKLKTDKTGYTTPRHGSLTNVPGVFVAGDVQDHRYRQAVTAAGSGCMAALDAEKFLEEHNVEVLS